MSWSPRLCEPLHPPHVGDWLESTAEFSPCGKYRYTLTRAWHMPEYPGRTVVFCMLNPSTADATKLDPTLTRCVSFARKLKFQRMVVVNIFAFRSTDPKELYKWDPLHVTGPGNDRAIMQACRSAGQVICGWGTHGDYGNRDREVLELLKKASVVPYCLGVTTAGHPRHPLYLAGDTRPMLLPVRAR
jgi:hypothetical protein